MIPCLDLFISQQLIFFIGLFCSMPDKLKASEKFDQYNLKVEDFDGRARKLENDILRYYQCLFFLCPWQILWLVCMSNRFHTQGHLCMSAFE